jgi:beta-galactosidase
MNTRLGVAPRDSGLVHPAGKASHRFRTSWFIALALTVFSMLLPSLRCRAQRMEYNFNGDWKLQTGDPAEASSVNFNDSHWKVVTLPHSWNEDDAFRVSTYDRPTGIAWYRKSFKLPAMVDGSRVLIEFQGVRQAAEVYLNGAWIGRSENGVMAFGFDLTEHLKAGMNVLAVRTDNSFTYREKASNSLLEWNNVNFYANFGGINKSVWLHIVPAVHQTLPLYSSLGTTGQYIWADHFNLPANAATIHAQTEVRNDSDATTAVSLEVEVRELDGRVVARAVSHRSPIKPQEITVLGAEVAANKLRFWSWGYGYLYNVVTTLMVNGKSIDSVTTRTGFRQTAFQNGEVSLNGRVMQIHGYAARSTSEWPALGTDVPPWISDFSNGLMVSDNANLVRWMHITPSKQDIESCDRVGLPQSMPAGDAEEDPKGREWEARLELMRDSIIYNRNNPSILFYEAGNKGISEEHMREIKAVRDMYDPHGGRAIGAREMLGSQTAEYGGEMLYIDKSATKPVWAHEYNREEGARKFWNGQTPPFHVDSPLYNRDEDAYTIEDVLRWDDYFRARPGTGKRVSAGGVNISFTDENSHFRGDNNYRRSGEVDAMRIPKDAFFAHQVMWDGWVEPEHPRVHIDGHWNYAAGANRTVYVVANTPKVELRLNGRSLGRRRPEHDFLFTFPDVKYEPGKLEAVGYGADDKPIVQSSLETAGVPAALRLTPHVAPGGMHADGSDLALVDVEVVDASGRRVPTALNMIHFRLDGPAEWRGGIAQGSAHPVPINTQHTDAPGVHETPIAPFLHQDNYILSQDLPVEGGINRVSIRSITSPGVVTVTAESDGLTSANIKLVTLPISRTDGLSTFDPAAALPVHLDRGPTPAGASFTLSRLPVTIVASTAGSNAADAQKSYDDDETTSWTSAGGDTHAGAQGHATSSVPAGAWIEYTLARPVVPTQIDLKLGAFRLRRYPLRITLDGAIVFEGLTPTSLGYVTLPLTAVKTGTRLRIELTAAPIDVGEAHALVEVNGKIDQAEPKGKATKPVLNIVEAEVYVDK